jgi:hypothetical protein
MRRPRLFIRLLLAILCLSLAAIVILLATGRIALCPIEMIGAAQQSTGPLACRVEFFINRYQALLGSLIALTAALYAVAPVWRQLRLISVQAATDLLPRLHDEAAEIIEDEVFLVSARQIEQELSAVQQYARDPRRALNVRVGDSIGVLEGLWRSLQALKQSSSIEHFANRITLSANQRNTRQALAAIFDDISSAHRQIMEIIKPPGGMPIAPYYEQISPQFSDRVEATLPAIFQRLKAEIDLCASQVKSMKSELQARTELVMRTAKRFVG